jgi:hypothetical protein
MVNEDSIAINEKTEAETINQRIGAVLTAGNTISQDTKLKLICDILELDYEEEKDKLEEEGPYNIDDILPDEGGDGDDE